MWTSRKCVLNKQIFSEKGTPQLVIWNSLRVWVPVQFSGINQSSQRNSLVPLISWFYYFPDSRTVSPYPHLSLLYWSPAKPRRGFFSLSLPLSLPLSIYPSATAERFSCRRGSFIGLHTQKNQKTATSGPSLQGFFAYSFFIELAAHFKKGALKGVRRAFIWHPGYYFAYDK